jgi:RNA-directed DNA polymerase
MSARAAEPGRVLTWAGEPLNAEADGLMNRRGKLDTILVNGPEDVALDWDAIDWRIHEQNVIRLRRRIFKATRELVHTSCHHSLRARGGTRPAPATPSRLA